jgi:hypothetical protein
VHHLLTGTGGFRPRTGRKGDLSAITPVAFRRILFVERHTAAPLAAIGHRGYLRKPAKLQ